MSRFPTRCRELHGALFLVLLATSLVLAPVVLRSTRVEGAAAARVSVPWPIVFVSRQGGDQPGVGGYSRMRPAIPGRLLVREADGTIRTLIDGRDPRPGTLRLVDVNAPDVSYDGQWIAFAGLPAPPADRAYPTGPGAHPGAWRIFVIRSDGSGLRQVTPEEDRSDIALDALRGYDDTDPVWLPDGRLVFSSTRWPSVAQYQEIRTTNLHVIAADGTGLRRITAERNGADRPLVDPITGRIVYARWWRNHRVAADDGSTAVDPDGGYIVKEGLRAADRLSAASDLQRNAWHAGIINPDGSGLAMWSGVFRDEHANFVYGGAFAADGTLFANVFPTANLADASGFGGIRRFTRGADRSTPIGRHARGDGPFVTEPEVLPDGRLIVSVAADVRQDYGLQVMRSDGSARQSLFDVPGATELRARLVRARSLPPVLADLMPRVAGTRAPAPEGPYDADGTFVFDALNVYFNAPVDTDIVSAPPIGSAATLRMFIDHQRRRVRSSARHDWPILLKSLPVSPGGAVRDNAAPAYVPLFEQIRSADETATARAPGGTRRVAGQVPLTGGPYPDGAAHVAGMNFAPAGSVARCVGCHAGHTLIPIPASLDSATWTNVAPGARISVSSTRDARANGGLVDRRALKAESSRSWTAAPGQQEHQWALLRFPVAITVKAVRLYTLRPGGDAQSSIDVHEATVRLFRDEAATQEVAAKKVRGVAVSGTDVVFTPMTARAVRVDLDVVTGTFAGARTAGLAEIEVIASGDVRERAPSPR